VESGIFVLGISPGLRSHSIRATLLKALRNIVPEDLAMDKKSFDELIKSVKQAGAIARGEKKPSRAFTFPQPNISRQSKKR
jgi:hypothetical protein